MEPTLLKKKGGWQMMNDPILIQVMGLLLAGNSRTEIREVMHSNDPTLKYSDAEFDLIYNNSEKLLEQTISTDPGQVLNVQNVILSEIYKYFENIQHVSGMNKAMKGRENLLGLIGGNKITINNKVTVNHPKGFIYDESRLSPDEKVEAYSYLNRCLSQPPQIAQPTQILQIAENVIETVTSS